MAIADELDRLGEYRIKRALWVASRDPEDGIAASTLLAIASRESGMQNVVSYDGGKDRGCFQISTVYHGAWLRSVAGCPSGSWYPAPGHSAYDPGHVPQFTQGGFKAVEILAAGVEYAVDHGIRRGERIAFAVASYNAGIGGAKRGYEQGNVDAFTTGGDYSADVLRRREAVQTYLSEKGFI